MSFTPRCTLVLSAALTSALLLAACGKKEPETPASAPTAPSTAAAPASTAPAAASTAPAHSSTAPAMPAPATTAAPAAAGATAAAAPAAAGTPLTVTKVALGSAVNADHEVTRESSRFANDDRDIYASVDTSGSSSGAKLDAKWTYLEGNGQMISSNSKSIATDGPSVTTFKVENPDLWPAGKYKVEISLDGKTVADKEFEIATR